MNPIIALGIAAFAVALLLWPLFRMAAKEDRRIERKSLVVPVNNHGLSPYSARPQDPSRSRVADGAFIHSRYCFWNDIYHYGGAKDVQYASPEQCIDFLCKKLLATGQPVSGDDAISEFVLRGYIFLAWYIDRTDKSVFCVAILLPEELERVLLDGGDADSKFLGFSWLAKDDVLEEIEKFETQNFVLTCRDWRKVGLALLKSDAQRFIRAVNAYLQEDEN